MNRNKLVFFICLANCHLNKMPEERRIEPVQTEDQAVTNFREYLRIKTVQPNPDYGKLRSVYSTWLKFGHNLNN